jgi:glycosyltransferase involved in cell wall biosynthesis
MLATKPKLSLLHVFPTFAVGGAQIRLVTVANHFGPAWQHAIVAMDGNTACRDRLHPDLSVNFSTVSVRKGDTAGNVLRFRRVLTSLRPDVMVTHNWGSIEWAMANITVGLRHVHIEDGFGPEERDRQIPRRVWLRRLLLRRAMVVLPSLTLESIATDIWRLPRPRVRYLPNGIDLGRFDPGTTKATPPPWQAPTAAPVIGTVAALRPEKNLGRLLRAFAQLQRPARLVIVGDGAERPALEALARELGVAAAVSFVGHMPDPQRAYHHFDIFALSSDTEQMPLSVLEAMASGLPIATTDVGDVSVMLAMENRPFVVQRDETALTGALAALLDAPALRSTVGAANRAKAERDYDQQAMFRAYGALLTGVSLAQ